MKRFIFIFILINFSCGIIKAQTITPDNISGACKILVELTDTTLKQKQFDRVAIYINTFDLIKQQYKVDDKYAKYFNEVKLHNYDIIGNWNISLNRGPRKNFVNLDINDFSKEQLKEIERQIKLKGNGIE